MRKMSIHRASLTLALFGVISLLAGGTLFAADHVIVLGVDEEFEINGRYFASGRISVREELRFTPSLMLSEVRVNGESLGLMLAELAPGPGVADAHSAVFERVPCGHLVLIGYSIAGKAPRELRQFRVKVHEGWSSSETPG